MNPRELSKAWLEPDMTRLSKRQIAIRLPLRVIAGIDAISVLFPRKNKTEVIGDLLIAALDEFTEGLSDVEPTGEERAEAERSGTSVMSQRHTYQFIQKARLRYLEERDRGEKVASGVIHPWVEFQLVDRRRAPKARGAARRITVARLAEGTRSDQPDRKRGPGRRPVKG